MEGLVGIFYDTGFGRNIKNGEVAPIIKSALRNIHFRSRHLSKTIVLVAC